MAKLDILTDAEISMVSGGHDSAWDKFWHGVGESIAEGIGNVANGSAFEGEPDSNIKTPIGPNGGGGW